MADPRDCFDTGSGALAGKTAPIGGTWTGAGSGNDFTVTEPARVESLGWYNYCPACPEGRFGFVRITRELSASLRPHPFTAFVECSQGHRFRALETRLSVKRGHEFLLGNKLETSPRNQVQPGANETPAKPDS